MGLAEMALESVCPWHSELTHRSIEGMASWGLSRPPGTIGFPPMYAGKRAGIRHSDSGPRIRDHYPSTSVPPKSFHLHTTARIDAARRCSLPRPARSKAQAFGSFPLPMRADRTKTTTPATTESITMATFSHRNGYSTNPPFIIRAPGTPASRGLRAVDSTPSPGTPGRGPRRPNS